MTRTNWLTRTTEERFWEKVKKTEGCWLWLGATTSKDIGNSYGRFYSGGKHVLAHRFSYTLLIGLIPEGLELDHLCRNTRCVRPDHLEPVTHQVNSIRGVFKNAKKTHCRNGHPYNQENTYVYPSGRERACKLCMRAASKRYEERGRK